MERILVARWPFAVGLVSCVVCGVLAWVNRWDTGWNTINGYDPVPALYLLPLGIVLFSYAVGGPLVRRGRMSGMVLERWLFLAGIGGFVATYAAALLVGMQFNPTSGQSYDWSTLTEPLVLVFVALLWSAVAGKEPTPPEPTVLLGPGGVPLDEHPQVTAPRSRVVPGIGDAPPRRADHLVLAAAVVALAIIFVFWTGYDPILYSSTSSQWTLIVNECGPGANPRTLPSVEPTFPLWAKVHVTWLANVSAFVNVWGPVGPFYGGAGTSGNFSFVSSARPFVIDASPLPFGSCSDLSVTIDATYTP